MFTKSTVFRNSSGLSLCSPLKGSMNKFETWMHIDKGACRYRMHANLSFLIIAVAAASYLPVKSKCGCRNNIKHNLTMFILQVRQTMWQLLYSAMRLITVGNQAINNPCLYFLFFKANEYFLKGFTCFFMCGKDLYILGSRHICHIWS